jgi:hypothetical protein
VLPSKHLRLRLAFTSVEAVIAVADFHYREHHDIKLYLDDLVFILGFDLEFQISPAMVSNKSYGHSVHSSSTPSSPPQLALSATSILLSASGAPTTTAGEFVAVSVLDVLF